MKEPPFSPTEPHDTGCRRCGTCCRKGGPTLHIEDQPLVERGVLPLKDLFTIRKGELVHENVRGELITTDEELIRLKGTAESWTCICLDENSSQCRIYTDRPIECRLLECWDPRKITAYYQQNRLTRRDLLAGFEGLWDLIADHDARCDYGLIAELTHRMQNPSDVDAKKQLSTVLTYDFEIRRLMVDQGGVDAEMLDLILGRPLTETMGAFGFKVTRESGRLIVKPCQRPVRRP